MAEEPIRPIQVKAKGKKLTTKRRKLLDNIPPEFRAQATEVVTRQPVPTETQPDPTFAAQQVGSSVEMDNTTQSQKVDEFLDTPMPVTLTETVVTGKNQLGTRTRTLDATIQSAVPGATVEEDVVHNIGAGRSVRERTVVSEVFSEDRYEVQKPDLVPEKFRGVIPQTTESHVSEGTAAMPTLGPADLAKSSEQLKEDVVRNTTTGRSAASLPVTLQGDQVNEVQQLEHVNETLDDAPQTLTPSALVQPGSKVEELGAGLTLKTEVTVAAVFERERFAKERPDVTPEVFKATLPQESTSIDSAGTAAMPTLGVGDISRSSEQVTDFIKRDSLTSRPAPSLPANVTDSVITPEGQVGTRVRTLDSGIQTVTPSALLKEGRVEALGDGRSEKTTITVPSVFERERFAKERPDVTPEVFRATIPQETTSIDSAGNAAMPTLGVGEISRSSEQVTDFVKRDSVASRPDPGLPAAVTDSVMTPEGQVGTRVRTLDTGVQTITPTATTKEARVETLGDGRSEKTVVTVPTVFNNNAFEKQRPDVTPEVFQATIPTETTKTDVAGTAAMPTLSAGDVSRSSRQKTEFVKEDTVTTRAGATLPASVTDSVMTAEGQVGTRVRTLDSGVQTISPSATTKEARVETLGDGRSEKTVITVPSVFDKAAFTKERPDVTPPVFKATIPQSTTRLNSAGTAADPTLAAGDISKSSEQVTAFEKQDTTVTRAGATLPAVVTDSIVTPEGQVGTRVRTLDTGVQSVSPSATTKEDRVEVLGDGTSERTRITVPSVFSKNVFQKERPDVTPQVFKATIPQDTVSTNSAGTAAAPTLGTGEISKTSEQVTAFEKRDTTVSRTDVTLPAAVTDTVLTPQGQVGTRVRTLDAGVQTFTPTATTKEAQVEVLGDGRSEKTVITVPSVFDEAVFSKQRPDVTPTVFKATIPEESTKLDSAGTAAMPTLGTGEVSRTSRQKNAFVKEDTVVTRAGATLPSSVTDTVMTQEGQIGTRVRTLDTGLQTFTPTATTKEAKVEVLGDGTSERSVISVPTVFGNLLFSADRPEVIPVAFRSAVPTQTTRLDEAGTASMPTLGVTEISKTMEQMTEFVRRVTTKTRAAPGSFPTLTMRSWDSDLQNEILTVMNIVAMGSAYTPGSDVIDYDEKEIDDNYSVRVEYKLPSGLPAPYDTREPAQKRFPGVLTGITVNKIQLADTATGDPRWEVAWFPVWRPGFTMDVNYIVTTTFHTSAPAPDTVYVIRTNDIVIKGISFQISIPDVLNDALSGIGVTFSGDGVYGNLSETYSVAASVPTAAAYNAAIGSTQVVASKVQPWRRLWVKRTTKVILL